MTWVSPAVLYEICRPDSKALTVMLPVNTTVQDVISAVAKPGGDHVLVKMNSAGGLHVATGARAVPPAFCQSCMMEILLFFVDSFLTERAQLKLDAAAVYTALGVNERLFICTSSHVEKLVRSVFVFFLKSMTENPNPNTH